DNIKSHNQGQKQKSDTINTQQAQPPTQPKNGATEEKAATAAVNTKQNHVQNSQPNPNTQQPQQPQQQAQQQQVNPTVEKMKATSRSYWAYFVRYIQQPSLAFQSGATEFTSAIISCVLYVVLLALSV